MAPLKAVQPGAGRRQGGVVSMLRGRGSIEGSATSTAPATCGSYPWLRGHGSIETLWYIFNGADTRRRTRARGLNI